MKGHANRGRYKQKDADDVYYCIRNYPDGIACLAEACRPLMVHPSAVNGYRFIAEKFDSVEGYGPTCVRKFVEQTAILGNRSPEQWQQDAFGQVDAWLRARLQRLSVPSRCDRPGTVGSISARDIAQYGSARTASALSLSPGPIATRVRASL
jgi:hypothetical protein